jgi:hypothetical protein
MKNLLNQKEITAIVKIIVFPLFSHKKRSDRLGKHKDWSKRQDFILTNLAILTDIWINVWVIILVFTDYKTAIILKLGQILGVEALSPLIAGIFRKFIN